METDQLHILLLAGGEGKRLWPASKALASLPLEKTFLETTLERALKISRNCWISCQKKDLLTFQTLLSPYLSQVQFIVEPEGKNTAAAVISAAYLLKEEDKPLLVLPIDHRLEEEEEFYQTIKMLLPKVEDHLITFGHSPLYPSEEYGYIRYNKDSRAPFVVEAFLEKPKEEIASAWIQEQNVLWNMGMILAKPSTIIEEAKLYCPDLLNKIEESLPQIDGKCFHLLESPWSQITPLSFDRAILEKTGRSLVQKLHSNWQDLGTWEEFSKHLPEDSSQNKVHSPSLPVIIEGIDHLFVAVSSRGIFIKKI